jgi:hypothetical protein
MPTLAAEALKKHGPLAAVLVLLMSAFTAVTMTIITKQGDRIEALAAQVNALNVQSQRVYDAQDFTSRMIDLACQPKEQDRSSDPRARSDR